MSKRTVAEVLVDELAEAGVTRLYGLVGDSLNPVSDALRRDDRSSFGRVRTPVHNRHLARRLKHAMGSGIGDLRPDGICAQKGSESVPPSFVNADTSTTLPSLCTHDQTICWFSTRMSSPVLTSICTFRYADAGTVNGIFSSG